MARENVEIPIGDPSKFQTTIDSYLRELGIDCEGALDDAITETGKEAVSRLQASSPTRQAKYGKSTGYARSWRFKKVKSRTGAIESKVYNEQGNLTHLLENGHPIMRDGVKVGQARAFPHIEPVNQWVQSELPRKFAEKMKKN